MIVEPGFVDDAKVVALELRLGRRHGPEAVKFILRLWEHCHIGKRGGTWGPLDGDYVERVARWTGRRGELFGHLTAVLVPGRAPFIELHAVEGQPVPNLVIHDWDAHNGGLKQRWNAGPNGRRGNPKSANAPEAAGSISAPETASGPEAAGSSPPKRERSNRTGPDRTGPDSGAGPVPAPPPKPVAQEAVSGGGFAEIPSWEEFLSASKQSPLGLPPLPEEFAAEKHAQFGGRDRFPPNWRFKLGADWRSEHRGWLAKKSAPGGASEKSGPLWPRIRALRERIAEHPCNEGGTGGVAECDQTPDLRAELRELRRELRELERQEGAGE